MVTEKRAKLTQMLLLREADYSVREPMQYQYENHQKWAIAGALFWLCLTLPALAIVPLFDYDETIYAQTAADMLRYGQWIVPIANGMEFFEKPPFTYYMMDLGFILFGENAFAARLPSAIFTLMTAYLLYRFAVARHDARMGLYAAAIYLSMFEVGLLAHAAILDAVLNFFIAGTLLAYLRWLDTSSMRHARWFAVMMGAAVAIKGPVGMVIPLLVIAVDRLLAGELLACLRRIPWLQLLPLFILFASPWYVMIIQAHGWEFLREFIMVHNIGRAMQPMQGHGGAWHYYLLVFAISSLPWLFWLPWVVHHLSYGDNTKQKETIRLCLVWIISVIVLFTLAKTKLPHYISSIYPALALALACAWQQGRQSLPRYIVPFTLLLLLPIAGLLLFFPWIYAHLPEFIHHPRAQAILAQDVQPSWWIASGGVALLLVMLMLSFRKLSHVSPLQWFIILGIVLQTSLMWPLASFAGRLLQGPTMQAAALIRQMPTDIHFYSYQLNAPSISFYAGRNYHILLGEQGRQQWHHDQEHNILFMREESLVDFPELQHQQALFQQGGFIMFESQQ